MSETQTWFAPSARKSRSTRSGAIGKLWLESVVFTRKRRFVFDRKLAARIRRATRCRPQAMPRRRSVRNTRGEP
jgi:hypothetical protein